MKLPKFLIAIAILSGILYNSLSMDKAPSSHTEAAADPYTHLPTF